MIGRCDNTCRGEVDLLILIAHLARNACDTIDRSPDAETSSEAVAQLKRALGDLERVYWGRS